MKSSAGECLVTEPLYACHTTYTLYPNCKFDLQKFINKYNVINIIIGIKTCILYENIIN